MKCSSSSNAMDDVPIEVKTLGPVASRVEEAISRGVSFLERSQSADGSWSVTVRTASGRLLRRFSETPFVSAFVAMCLRNVQGSEKLLRTCRDYLRSSCSEGKWWRFEGPSDQRSEDIDDTVLARIALAADGSMPPSWTDVLELATANGACVTYRGRERDHNSIDRVVNAHVLFALAATDSVTQGLPIWLESEFRQRAWSHGSQYYISGAAFLLAMARAFAVIRSNDTVLKDLAKTCTTELDSAGNQLEASMLFAGLVYALGDDTRSLGTHWVQRLLRYQGADGRWPAIPFIRRRTVDMQYESAAFGTAIALEGLCEWLLCSGGIR